MNYDQAVVKARSLHGRSETDQWELARLTHEFTTTGPEARTLTEWARDCGFTQPHATNLRKTWEMFGIHKGPYDRSNLSFNECYTIAAKSPERAKELTEKARRRHRSVSTVERNSRRRHPGDALDDLRDAMHDGKRRRRLLEDPEIRDLVRRDMDRMRTESEDTGEPMDDDVVDLLEELTAIRYRLLFILKAMVDAGLTEQERKELLPVAVEIRDAVKWMQGYLNSGATSFEDALEAMLDEAPPTKRITDPTPAKRRTPKPKVVPIAPADEATEPEPPAEPPAPVDEPHRGAGRRRIPVRSSDPTKRRAHGKRAG